MSRFKSFIVKGFCVAIGMKIGEKVYDTVSDPTKVQAIKTKFKNVVEVLKK